MDDHQEQVHRLIELTNGDEDVARSVLASVDWDVQRAADLIFGHAPSTSTSHTMQAFDIDDSDVRPLQPAHPAHVHAPAPVARPLWTWLTLPLHILSSVVRFIFNVLRIPLPRFATLTFYLPFSLARFRFRGSSSSSSSSGYGSVPKGPEAWLRQLEDETGAISVGRIRPRGEASGVASSSSSSAAGTSLTSRRGGAEEDPDTDGRKRLPDFMLSSYEDFLRACQREYRIGCVVLVSAEHDDVAEFKRSTLTDPALIKALQDNNILVWGGDVRDREAWSAAEKLQASTYPFVAFIALQPSRAPRSSSLFPSTPNGANATNGSTEPSLTVLSRHQGPAAVDAYTPSASASTSTSASSSSQPNNTADELTPTSARALLAHLTHTLLPRVSPYLATLSSARRAAQSAIEQERAIRRMQDEAFERSARRDRERLEARLGERERREREERERVDSEREREREQREREQREERERERRERERMGWRRWARRALVGAQASATGTGSAGASAAAKGPTLRVAVRLPSGKRILHSFALSAGGDGQLGSAPTLTTLFALVDAAFVPEGAGMDAEEDPVAPPASSASFTSSISASAGKRPEDTLDAYISSLLSNPSTTSKDAESVYWSFRLLTAYPRAEVRWAPATPLASVPLLVGSSLSSTGAGTVQQQLVVEMVYAEDGSGRRKSGESRRSGESTRRSMDGRRSVEVDRKGKGKGKEKEEVDEKDASDDGYETESSDEE